MVGGVFGGRIDVVVAVRPKDGARQRARDDFLRGLRILRTTHSWKGTAVDGQMNGSEAATLVHERNVESCRVDSRGDDAQIGQRGQRTERATDIRQPIPPPDL